MPLSPLPTPLPSHGSILQTEAVARWAENHIGRRVFLQESIARHLRGDDGDLDEEDKQANEAVRRAGSDTGRVLSAYKLSSYCELAPNDRPAPDPRLWIDTILAGKDTYTTVLFPSDY